VVTRNPAPTRGLGSGLLRTQTSRLRPPTPGDLRTTIVPLSGIPPPSSQVSQSFSFGGRGRPPTSMGPEWSSAGPSGSGIGPLSASSPPVRNICATPCFEPAFRRAPSKTRNGARSRPSVDLRLSMARPARNVDILPPTDHGRGGHHSASASVGGYPPPQGVHTQPLVPPP